MLLLGSEVFMEFDRSKEKSYTLLIEGLTLEEKSFLYNKAKLEGSTQNKIVLKLIKNSMKAGGQ